MSQRGKVVGTVAVAGETIDLGMTRTGEGTISQQPPLVKALAGVLKTYVSGTSFTLTVTGHSWTGTEYIDVYWLDPTSGDHKCAYGCHVDSVASDDVIIDFVTGGDAMPDNVTMVVQAADYTEVNCVFAGDELKMLAVGCAGLSHIDFQDAGGSEYARLMTPNEGWMWASNWGVTNPVAGDSIIKIRCSTGEIDTNRVMNIGLVLDSVP